MEQVSYTLRLDLKDTGIVNTGFRLKQGDSGMKISVSIFNRGVNVFDSTTVPKIVFKRPDGASVMANMTVGASVYEYVFVGNELQQPGVEIMDVKFTLPNDKRESTVSCSFVVVPDTITPNTHGSDIYDNDLAELVAEATAAAETVEEVVGDSEAWAVGERNGVPVGPEDPAYHNNSKWWSEQANVTSLAALTDVDLDNPADEDGLVYNGTSQKWKNVPIMTKEQWKKNGAYNLLPMTYTNHVISGATAIVNADGSVTIDTAGSATTGVANFVWDVPLLGKVGAKYRLVGCPSGGGANTYYVNIYDNGWNDGTKDYGSGNTFTLGTGITQAVISIRSGVVVDHLTFKPMITTDLDATYDDYVPYAKTNEELTNLPNNLGASVDLTGYTSENNMYEFPSDGYVRYAIRGNQSGTVTVYGNNGDSTGSAYLMFGTSSAINSTTTTVLRGSVYVRKGMKAFCTGTLGSADFIALK